MKILFLSHYFPPEVNAPATRTYEHCRRWVEAGHTVTVVSCIPHHPMGEVYPGYRNRWFQTEDVDGINAAKVLTYVTANEGVFRRSANYIFYMVMTILACRRFGPADVVISTSPQFFNGLAGYFLSRIKRCPWVLEVRDLWPESIVAVDAVRNPALIRMLLRLEKFVYAKADHVVPVTHPFETHISNTANRSNGITVIPNGMDLHRLPAANRVDGGGYNERKRFVVAYIGTHGMAHGLDTLVDAAALLTHRGEISILFVGDGAERTRLAFRVEELGLTNVKMLGQLTKPALTRLYADVDACVVMLKDHEMFTKVIPSKIFESMAMSKPIILAARGESERIVRESQAGICVNQESPADVATAILKLSEDPESCRKFGVAGRAYVAKHFDRRVLAEQYLMVLEDLVKHERQKAHTQELCK